MAHTANPHIHPPLPIYSPRSFYEDLPDLLNTYPPNLLGLTEEEAEKLREEERAKQKERANAANTNAGGEGGGDGETEGGQVVESGDDALTEEMKGLALGDGEERGNRGGDEEADAGGGDGKGDGGASDEEVSSSTRSRREFCGSGEWFRVQRPAAY